MAKRNKNEHLLLRGQIWWFNRHLSGSNRYVRRSLGTSDLESARAQRDAILARWDEQRTRIADARNVVALRKLYLDTLDSDEKSLIEEQIIDRDCSRYGLAHFPRGSAWRDRAAGPWRRDQLPVPPFKCFVTPSLPGFVCSLSSPASASSAR